MTLRKMVAGAFLCALLISGGAGAGCRRSRPPIRSPLEQDQVRPEAEWLRMEPVRLLRDYIRIDTTSRQGPGEREGALFLQRFFECAGIDSELVCPAPGRCNLLARIPGRRREGALLLLNHIDVVGAFPELWKDAPPFSGAIKNGYLYGRGAYDMKSLALCQAIALRRLKESGITPETDILFLAEADEEVEEEWGSRWLLEHRPEWFRGVAAVVNEGGTNEIILRQLRFWGVEALQAGYGTVEFEADSQAALQDLAKAVSRFPGETVEPHPQVVESFAMLAGHLPYPQSAWLSDLSFLRKNPEILHRWVADRYGSFLEPRIHWEGPYAFPPNQTRTFRSYVIASVPPGIEPDLYLDPIAKRAPSSVRVVSHSSSGPTVASPYPTPFTELLKRVSLAFHPGVPFGPVPTFGGMTTSMFFRRAGIPAYGYSPILMNITDEVRRHGNDERVFLRDYVNGVEILDQVVKEYAFFPEKTPGFRP
ncbi:MAG: M20/M25/M40 family metallo-hydrolase, partial [Acidobacteriota bacterium]|nr:M20/M25/M40 family metallo-hydrolase [Acidobacteriota bacterium]